MKENLYYIDIVLKMFNLKIKDYNKVKKELEQNKTIKIYDVKDREIGLMYKDEEYIYINLMFYDKIGSIVCETCDGKYTICYYFEKENKEVLEGKIRFSMFTHKHKNVVKTSYKIYKDKKLKYIGKFGSFSDSFFIKDYDTNERIENYNNDIVHEKGETKRKVYYDKSYVFYNRNYDEKRFYTSGGVEVNEKIEKILQDILIDISPEYYEFIDKQRLELDKFIPGLFDKLVRKTLIYKDNYELGCLLDVNRKNIKKIKYTK